MSYTKLCSTLILCLISNLLMSQTPTPTVDWNGALNRLNKDLERNETERQNKRLYYENLKNESLNNMYGATNTIEFNSCNSYILKQMYLSGQQAFIQSINNSYNNLTSGRLPSNTYISNVNSINSQFLYFSKSFIMLSNQFNSKLNRGISSYEIDQDLNSIYNNNVSFIINPQEIQVKSGYNQITDFNRFMVNILGKLNAR